MENSQKKMDFDVDLLVKELNKCQINTVLSNIDIYQIVLYKNPKPDHAYKQYVPATLIGNTRIDDKFYDISVWESLSRAGRTIYKGQISYRDNKVGSIFIAESLRQPNIFIGSILLDEICYAIEASVCTITATNYTYLKGRVKLPEPSFFSQATFTFIKSERGFNHIEKHKKELGYNILADVHKLCIGDEIAFPYANNMFRSVIAFKGVLPDKNPYIVLNESIDLNVWQKKDLSQQVSGMRQLTFYLHELEKVDILKKSVSDTRYVQELLDFYHKAFRLMGRKNFVPYNKKDG